MEASLAHLQENIWLYLSIPVISGLVGWGTNALAVRMMFFPIHFVGKPPFLGWQGVVPKRAAKLAGVTCDQITQKLITMEELFQRIDPNRIAEELEPVMNKMTDEMVDDIMLEHQPELWTVMPVRARNQVKKMVAKDMPGKVAEIMDEVREDVDRVFDVRDMVVTNMERDRHLLVKLFLEMAHVEFKFVIICGLYFGFLFGIFQMLVWIFYKGDWVLPAFGLAVGYATNYVALLMIYEPREPMKIGPFTFHGIMHKRQKQIAADYGRICAAEILTPAHMMEAILKGPLSDRMFALVERHVKRAVDEAAGISRPFLAMSIGTQKYLAMKDSAVKRVMEHLPEAMSHVEDYLHDAMGLADLLSERMAMMDAEDFEMTLRTAMEEDEWQLIAVGAALGLGVGIFQYTVMFAGVL